MKKLTALILAIALTLTLVACGGNDGGGETLGEEENEGLAIDGIIDDTENENLSFDENIDAAENNNTSMLSGEWQKLIGIDLVSGSEMGFSGDPIILKDGNIVFVYTDRGGTKLYIKKISILNGDVMLEKVVEGSFMPFFFDVKETLDGGFVLVSADTITKFDSEANIVNQVQSPLDVDIETGLYSVDVLPDGTFIAVGWARNRTTNGSLVDPDNYIYPDSSVRSVNVSSVIIKFDINGDVLWHKIIDIHEYASLPASDDSFLKHLFTGVAVLGNGNIGVVGYGSYYQQGDFQTGITYSDYDFFGLLSADGEVIKMEGFSGDQREVMSEITVLSAIGEEDLLVIRNRDYGEKATVEITRYNSMLEDIMTITENSNSIKDTNGSGLRSAITMKDGSFIVAGRNIIIKYNYDGTIAYKIDVDANSIWYWSLSKVSDNSFVYGGINNGEEIYIALHYDDL